jgi:hypothetical protein
LNWRLKQSPLSLPEEGEYTGKLVKFTDVTFAFDGGLRSILSNTWKKILEMV